MHNPPMTRKDGAHRGDEIEAASLADRLQQAMDRKGSNPNRIEVATGIPRQTLYAALRGQTRNFTYEKLVVVSEHLGVRPEWLARGEAPMCPTPELKDEDEIQLIRDFRDMSPSHQRDLAEIARRWADEDTHDPTGNRPFYHPKPPKQQ